MSYSFDDRINRKGTQSLKWDQAVILFGGPDVLPLWVADMDFACPPAVVEAVTERSRHGIYGYTVRTDEYSAAITNWFSQRHEWEIKSSWLTDTPGVVPSLSIAVQTLTDPGDEVILQSPVYYPFFDVITHNGRKVAENPLLLRDERYEMDFEHLETLMQSGARLLLLCSPHNPGGRVWTREELERLLSLCVKYNVIVVTDEIHCDLVFEGHKHYPFASLSEEAAGRTITCLAPSKTFNMPGLQTSFTVISNRQLKQKFDQRIQALGIGSVGFFGPPATIAAYNEGGPWLDELLKYVQANHQFAVDYIGQHLPELAPVPSEGTYLLWVDYRKLNLSTSQLKQLMYSDAKVAFTEGSIYGQTGAGFLRINLACPRDLLVEALERFGAAVRSLRR